MDKKKILEDFDIADSEFRSFEFTEENTLIVYLTSWDAKLLTVIFSTPIHFTYDIGDGISSFFEVAEKSVFLDEALSRYYVNIPCDHSFKLFMIEDLNDYPFIQVVATSITISKGSTIIGLLR